MGMNYSPLTVLTEKNAYIEKILFILNIYEYWQQEMQFLKLGVLKII